MKGLVYLSFMNKEHGPKPFSQTFFHGTKADLKIGDLVGPGAKPNYGTKEKAKYIYFAATLDAAIWGAELAAGEGRERIYLVEPIGPIENDPNLTDKKFSGNPTMSYRSEHPLKIVGELAHWRGHNPEQVRTMKESIKTHKERGVEIIED